MPRGIPGSTKATVPFQTQYTVLTGTQKSSLVTALKAAMSILEGQHAPAVLSAPKVIRRRRRRNTAQVTQEQVQ